jgi:hypothetical protein
MTIKLRASRSRWWESYDDTVMIYLTMRSFGDVNIGGEESMVCQSGGVD